MFKLGGLSTIEKGLIVQYILFWVGKPERKDCLVWLGIDGMKVIKMNPKRVREHCKLKVSENSAADNI
jgi:hypothetical protein